MIRKIFEKINENFDEDVAKDKRLERPRIFISSILMVLFSGSVVGGYEGLFIAVFVLSFLFLFCVALVVSFFISDFVLKKIIKLMEK